MKLDVVLKNASMVDRTVILTTLNDAWAEPNNIFDLFLESFRIGNHTHWLLKHLVIICLDQKAYARCLASHPHCYNFQIKGDNFTTEALFMTPSYLKMMWTRIDLLRTILEMGYNFVFTVISSLSTPYYYYWEWIGSIISIANLFWVKFKSIF